MSYYEQTNKVKILLEIKSGTVIIQGPYYKVWADKVSPTLKSTFDVTVENNGATIETIPWDAPEHRTTGQLWDENDTLKSSAKCLEKTVELSNRCLSDEHDLIKQQASEFEHRLKHLEKKYVSHFC